jgi:hypothetical protein
MEQNQITGLWETALGVVAASMSALATAVYWVLKDRAEVAMQINSLQEGLAHLRETFTDESELSQSRVTQHQNLHDAVIRLELEVRTIKERLDRGHHTTE